MHQKATHLRGQHALKVTQSRKAKPLQSGVREVSEDTFIGHTPQEEAGIHDLGVSANPTPYSEKEKWVLTLFSVGWKGSLIFTRDNTQVPALAMVPAVPGKNSTTDLTQGHAIIPLLKTICQTSDFPHFTDRWL